MAPSRKSWILYWHDETKSKFHIGIGRNETSILYGIRRLEECCLIQIRGPYTTFYLYKKNWFISYKAQFKILTVKLIDTQKYPFSRLTKVRSARVNPYKIPIIVYYHPIIVYCIVYIPSALISGFQYLFVLVKLFTLFFT